MRTRIHASTRVRVLTTQQLEYISHAFDSFDVDSDRICADGGANRIQGLWDEYKRAVSELEYTGRDSFKHPHRIVGDMDSIESSVAAIYRENKELGCYSAF